jgi:hypothetical protein
MVNQWWNVLGVPHVTTSLVPIMFYNQDVVENVVAKGGVFFY